MRTSSGIHQKTGSLQILSEKTSCRNRREEDTFHGYPHVAGVEMWACHHQIDLCTKSWSRTTNSSSLMGFKVQTGKQARKLQCSRILITLKKIGEKIPIYDN